MAEEKEEIAMPSAEEDALDTSPCADTSSETANALPAQLDETCETDTTSPTVNTLLDLLFFHNDTAGEKKASDNSGSDSRGSRSNHLSQNGTEALASCSDDNVSATNSVTRTTSESSSGSGSGSNTSFTRDNGTVLSTTAVTCASTGATMTRTSTLLTPVRYRSSIATAGLNRRTLSSISDSGLQPPMFFESETRVWAGSLNGAAAAAAGQGWQGFAQSSPAPRRASYDNASLPLSLLRRCSTTLASPESSTHENERATVSNTLVAPQIPQLTVNQSVDSFSSNHEPLTVLASAYLVEPTRQEPTNSTPTATTHSTSGSFATPLVAQPLSTPRAKSPPRGEAWTGITAWWRSLRPRSILLALAGTVVLVVVVVATGWFLGDSRQPTGPSVAPLPPLPLVIATTLELYEAVDAYLQSSSNGNGALSLFAPIGTWDVSRVTNFSRVFDPDRTLDLRTSFNDESGSGGINTPFSLFDEDISAWDVSSGATFYGMFAYSSNFNGDVSNWNLSLATDTSYMFHGAARFNGDVSQWKVGRVTTMENMFYGAARFESDLSAWDVSNVQSMRRMFDGALLIASDLSDWNVSAVQDLSHTFRRAPTLQCDLSAWDVSSVTLMAGTFQFATLFAGDLSSWNVSRVTSMHEMFADAVSFASDVSGWDVRSVQDTTLMFQGASSFHVDLCDWGARLPSNVASDSMFLGTACPNPSQVFIPIGPLCHVCNAPNTTIAFTTTEELYRAVDLYLAEPENADSLVAMTYGHPMGSWDVSRLSDFTRVFDPDRGVEFQINRLVSSGSTFSEDLSDWDMSAATTLTGMFAYASAFNGNISNWNTSSVSNMDYLFAGAGQFNGDISKWDVANVASLSFSFYSADQFNSNVSEWDVSNVRNMNGMFQNAVVFDGDVSTWNVSKVVYMESMFSGASMFNGDLSSWDVANVNTVTSMFDHATSFASDISKWNVARVAHMAATFRAAVSFRSELSDWDVGNVLDTNNMFAGLISFNSDLSRWNVSKVRFMGSMFDSATIFSSDLSQWDVGNVESMERMFADAASFDSDISAWDVSRVTTMKQMFIWAGFFNQGLSSWSVYNVTDMTEMFQGASRFNQNLCSWGPRLPSGTLVRDAFRSSACSNRADPSLPGGPFCTSCT
jgi:surface protein